MKKKPARPAVKKRKLKVEWKNLPDHWGLATIGQDLVEADKTLRGKQRLNILVHEALHHLAPRWSEARVVAGAELLADMLWSQRYRMV